MTRATPAIERAPKKIVVDANGCWNYTGSRTAGGYGMIRERRRPIYVHRLMYEALVGPIPEGLQIDHLCRNRACCRPSHLEPVTNAVNGLRGESLPAQNARKTHCPQGHPYDEANTLQGRSRRGRHCRTCNRERGRASYIRNPELARAQQRARWAARKADSS